nr:Gag-Pol polyprotein [Tanacetum cinerariifolium]
DARLKNFEIQFLKESAKFVGDFKSLAKEADDSLAKHNALELEIERLLKAVVNQDVMNIVQKESVVDTSDLQTELEPYKDMKQKIEWFQAQLGDLKGKRKDTSSVSDTRNSLSQKLEQENVELEFQVLNYARENDHLKATYKNLVYNRRTKKIIETMNVSFDELLAMVFEQSSSKPRLNSMTSGHISSGLNLTYAPSTITTQQLSEGELDLLFEAMYDDYFSGQPSATVRTVPPAQEPQVRQSSTASTTIADIAPIPTNSSSHATHTPITSQDVNELNPNAMIDDNTFVNPFANSSTCAAAASSSQNLDPSNMHTFYQPYPHEFQWTKDHPLEQVIGEPSRPVVTRNQLRSDGDMCMYVLSVSSMKQKNVKEAMTDSAWIDSMQEELLQFKRLDVWVLVPAPDNISPLTLKWLFKNKHDKEQTVIRNKSRLVVRGYRQEEGIDFK